MCRHNFSKLIGYDFHCIKCGIKEKDYHDKIVDEVCLERIAKQAYLHLLEKYDEIPLILIRDREKLIGFFKEMYGNGNSFTGSLRELPVF